MFKSLAIAAVVSTMAFAAPITSAEAKTNINLDIGFNLGGGYPVDDHYPSYEPYPVYEPAPVYYEPEPVYVDHCGAARLAVKHQGFKKVRPIDCDGSTFAFKAKRHGDWWIVRTNRRGYIKTVQAL